MGSSTSTSQRASRTTPPLSSSSHVDDHQTFLLSPLSPAFSSLPWSELEQQGIALRAWCRVDRLPHGGFGLTLNDCNALTQMPTNPLCTLKPFDTVVEVDGMPLEGRLCDALHGKRSSIVLTVLRPTVSVDQLLRAAAKLDRRGGTSSALRSPSRGWRESSPREERTLSAPAARHSPQASPTSRGTNARFLHRQSPFT